MPRSHGTELPKQADRWPPPSLGWYASDELASETFMFASLAERGLLISMLSYAWVNGSVPAERSKLAVALRVDLSAIEASYGRLVEEYFRPLPEDPARLYAPELARQLQRMAAVRQKQSKAATETNRKRRQVSVNAENNGPRSPSRLATRSPSRSSHAPELNELNRKDCLQEGELKKDPFVEALGEDYGEEPVHSRAA